MDNSELSINNNISHTKKENIFSSTFLLLWQGQLVSGLGDVVYSMALGFWILARTGSTALMGSLMAASVLPGVLVSPFAGVVVDRSDKKRLLILMDLLRGLSIVFISIAAFKGFLAVWMVFTAGIILSVCGAFFHPTTNSVVPDIVPKSKLTNANSIFGMISPGSNIIGSSMGGFIFQLVGAPVMFLFNGLSFIFSGSSIALAKIPKLKKVTAEQHFFKDMKDGFVFVWKFKGLRYMLTLSAVLNFFAYIGIVLVLPLFQKTSELGSGRYGIIMSCFTGGILLGMIVTALLKIPPKKKMLIYMSASLTSCIFFSAFPLVPSFLVMCIFILLAGILNSITNVFIMSSIQASVPENMRGKVFSLLNTITQGLTPIAMAFGGVLGEFFPIKYVIASSFMVVFLCFLPFAFSISIKKFINFDPKTETLQDII